MSWPISAAIPGDPGIRELWQRAFERSGRVRGLAQIEEVLEDVDAYAARSCAFSVVADGLTIALGIVDEGIIKFLFVTPSHRRQGVARDLVAHLVAAAHAQDAWALPGDRASKSLFESIGWRARLITMRGA